MNNEDNITIQYTYDINKNDDNKILKIKNNDDFKKIIEPKLREHFLKFYFVLNSKFSNVLYNADEEHVETFIDIIKYHIIKNNK